MGPQEHEVERNPSHRSHQEKLLNFRDEVSCIQKVLHDQLERTRDIEDMCRDSSFLRSSSNDQAILDGCMQLTEERIASFEEMNTRANNLVTYVSLRSLSVSVPRPYLHSKSTAFLTQIPRTTSASKQTKTGKKPPSFSSRSSRSSSSFYPSYHHSSV